MTFAITLNVPKSHLKVVRATVVSFSFQRKYPPHVLPFTMQTRESARAEVYMGWVYSAASFCTVSVRTQPVVSTRPGNILNFSFKVSHAYF